MRIGLNGTFWNMETTGSGQYIRHLLPVLREQASESELVLFLPQYLEALTADRYGNGFPTRSYPLSTPFDPLDKNLAKLWFEQIAYPRACRRFAADVAHVPYFAPPLHSSVPTVVTIHDLIPLVLPDYRGSRLVQGYMRLVSRAACRAALVLTDSHASARDIARLLKVPQERLRVIYLAAGAQYRPLSPEERDPTLRRLGIPPRYLLYLGGFDRRKNIVGLLHAFARARQRLDDVILVIAGQLPSANTAFRPDPQPIAAQLGIAGQVQYTGWVAEEDKPALYSSALGFVFPSFYEGFGLPVLEAISCGTPAIVGRGSSLEEIAGPGGIGVPPDNTAAMADALVRLAQDAPLRQMLAAAGLSHARSFSWQRTAQQTWAAYRDALGS